MRCWLESCGYFVKYDRAVSEVVVRFALSVFPFGLLLPSYNLGCLTFSFDVCIADDVSVSVMSEFRSQLWAGRDIAHGLGES